MSPQSFVCEISPFASIVYPIQYTPLLYDRGDKPFLVKVPNFSNQGFENCSRAKGNFIFYKHKNKVTDSLNSFPSV